jgi:hypothetical protein
MPGPLLVQSDGQHRHFLFRCDDRAGFLLDVLWASDGDLHLSITADPDHEDYAVNSQYISGSVRLRLPLIGGGRFEHLHQALVTALRAEAATLAPRGAPNRS